MGPKHAHAGYIETLEALKNHPGIRQAARPQPGPRRRLGLLVQRRRRVERHHAGQRRRHVLVATGSVDVGGSRASMALMAAETLGVDYSQVRRSSPIPPRSATPTSPAAAASPSRPAWRWSTPPRRRSKNVRARAAMIWDVDVDGVSGKTARQAGLANVGDFKPMSLKEIAGKAAATGGPITAAATVNAGGQAPGFASQFCDVEVDPETGKVTILRFVAAQDVGTAIHPSYVEGQIQGGVVQGIGWALNEEYIYDAKGRCWIMPASSIIAARSRPTCR
jgi:CO/xanthine dehydrogenase Mo-binding subunit